MAASRTANLLAAGHSQPAALTSGFHLAFAIGAACVGLGIVLALTILRSPAAQPEPPSTEEPGIREGLLADEMV